MLRRSVPLVVLVVGLLNVTHASARTIQTGIESDIEPIIGYERVQKVYPTPHTKERLTYGARAWLGFPLFAIETEYLAGTDTETFTSPSASVTETDQKAKAGLRSQIRMGSFLWFILRAGGQAKQTKSERTISGVTTSTTSAWIYKPYAGAGLKIGLMKHLAFTAEIVSVFANYPNTWTDNEYQATAGFTIHFP